ncbi:hypothetical protein [Sphingomonas sp. SAFR-052]|uniref:hypothetical protein n=1 Tax=Sphingomonas sp. SAFR-052 TaxID=3436867 RepID=UPI003F7E77BF
MLDYPLQVFAASIFKYRATVLLITGLSTIFSQLLEAYGHWLSDQANFVADAKDPSKTAGIARDKMRASQYTAYGRLFKALATWGLFVSLAAALYPAVSC